MKSEDTVEYNSLRWVKKELDLILHEAQASLSAYIEDTDESDRLRECIEHLHMVQGTLQMVELYGAAQLAEEMEHVASALLNDELDKKDDAYDVLMRSMLQLPDYLESLQSGSKDVPMVLLPLLNDLRASRKASLLSENVLFFPDIDASTEDVIDTSVEPGKLLTLAKKLRPHFQIGLVGWFKGDKVNASLKRILAVLNEFEKNSPNRTAQRLWSISAALTDGLLHDGLDSSVSVKMLLGQVDRSIKQLIDSGEEVFAKEISSDLLKNLLYYVARVNKDSDRIIDIKKTYRLAELLPGDTELEEARSGLGGLNTELLRTVSQGIREDMLEVKDVLEIFVHSESPDTERLTSLPDLLNKIADTLAMLGLGGPREQVLVQKEKIEQMIAGQSEANDDEIMSIASVLLTVEAQLNNFIANRSVSDGESTDKRVGDFGSMPEAEYNEVLSAVIREALQDFSDARQAILGYLENSDDKDLLNVVLKRLGEIDGAMFMLPVQRLKPQLDAIRNYVRKVLLGAGQFPDQAIQDNLADVVTSVEYFLEAILEGRPDLELSLSAGEKAAESLEQISAQYADVVEQEGGQEPEASTPDVKSEQPAPRQEIEQVKEAERKAEPASTIEKTQPTAAPSSEEARYAILGDDADPEILEIFIEEALEELGSLNEQIPLWTSNPDNSEALTTIRRSFHTLKGSGRLIGAELIGEFAWNFENMLNRVIDKSRPASQDVFDLLDEALGVLPQLIEQLKGNREPVSNVYSLIDQADALSKWRKGEPMEEAVSEPATSSPVAEKAPDVPVADASQSVIEDDTGAGESADFGSLDTQAGENEELGEISIDDLGISDSDFDVSSDDDELEISEASVPEFDFEDTEADVVTESESDDNFDIDLTDDIEALQMAISPQDEDEEEISFDLETDLDEPEQSVTGAVTGSQIHMDPVLFKIFKGESESHLAEIRRMLNEHRQGDTPLTANAGLTRALHTLFGSARTAEVGEIAELCGELEKLVHLYQGREDSTISEEGVQLVDDVVSTVGNMLVALENDSAPLESEPQLLARIRGLSEKIEQQAEPVPPAPSTESTRAREPAAAEEAAGEVESLVSYSEVDEELVDIFLEEAEELLDGCENSLQRWNNNAADEDSVQDLQRQLHTLKGGARMADLTPIGNLTHALESLIISVNDGQIGFSKDMSYILHDAMDRLSDMLSKVKSRQPISSEDRMIAAIEAMRRGEPVDVKKSEEPTSARKDIQQEISLEDIASIEFEEDEDQLESVSGEEVPELDLSDQLAGEDEEVEPEIIFDEEPEINETAVDGTKIPSPQQDKAEISGQDEHDKSTLELPRQKAAGKDTQEESRSSIAHEQVRVRSDLLNDLVNHAGEVSVYHARMGQQITGFSFNLSEMDQTVIRLREQLRKLSIETEAQILSRYEKESDQYDEAFDPLEMDRFSTMQQISRSLQETVGDIESIKNILGDNVRDAETLLLQESRVSSDLQEGLMRTRMVHFGGLASRLRRIVRQTARELDKEVELDIAGETSEVDRTVLDRIVAPLEHMLRNAVSHGIESPRDRAQKSKPETGTIKIIVDREGGDVVIKVVDDGRGIDVNSVRKRATEQGLIVPENKLSDHDVLQFIMQPGFSTAEKVTQISGRGVGMDVVDSEIKQLGGVLEIDTIQGKGTTFIIRLPLTLAINHALLVSAGEEIYAVPLNSIEGVVRLSGMELQAFYDSGDRAYEFAGTQYDLRHLGYLLTGSQPNYSRSGQLFPVLLAHVGDQRVAIHVDELLGRREIVVKPVGPQISGVRGISGATILGDGRVVLILEMNALVLGETLFHVTETEEEEQRLEIPEVIEEQHETVVMVVDDSITIRKVTERMLSRHNMRVVTAKDGVDAVSQLQDITPDIMLLDIEMPRMDGYEVATHVRNDDRLKDLPIIMITSRTGSKHREKAMDIGVNKYLGKPYQEDELMQNINELIG